MKLPRYVYPVAALLLAVPLLAACSGSNDQARGTQNEEGSKDETVEIISVASGSAGGGPAGPRAVVAGSLDGLPGVRGLGSFEPESAPKGDPAYLAALWGEKRTGGYSIEVDSARREGGRVVVKLDLREPPEGAMVTQAITYPYAIVALRGVGVDEEFVLEDSSGDRIDWPVRKV